MRPIATIPDEASMLVQKLYQTVDSKQYDSVTIDLVLEKLKLFVCSWVERDGVIFVLGIFIRSDSRGLTVLTG